MGTVYEACTWIFSLYEKPREKSFHLFKSLSTYLKALCSRCKPPNILPDIYIYLYIYPIPAVFDLMSTTCFGKFSLNYVGVSSWSCIPTYSLLPFLL